MINKIIKKIGITLFSVLLFQTAFAQNTSNEIYASYGVGSVPQIGISIGSALGNALGNAIANGIIMRLGGTGVTYEEEITGTGAISLGYNHYLKDRWTLGGQATFEQVNDKLVFSNGNVGTNRFNVYSLMLRTDFKWINNPKFQFYSSLAGGGSLLSSFDLDEPNLKDNEYLFAFQVTPIGLRFGQNLGFFFEGGVGWTGLLIAGVSGKF